MGPEKHAPGMPEAGGEQPIDPAYFLQEFGLGPEEISATAEFGSYRGTVAAMLTDPKCPVGGMVASAYKAGGIDAVQNQFNLLGQMSPQFSVSVGEKTRGFHEGTVHRDELLKQPEQTELPVHQDFLDQNQLEPRRQNVRNWLRGR